MMNFGLDLITQEKFRKLFEKHPQIEQVILYGSRAKGNFREGSDIDLTLIGNISEDLQRELTQELDDLNTPYLIDISIFDQLKSLELIAHIQRVGKVFYQKGW